MEMSYKNITILIVDHNERIRKATRDTLQRIGFEKFIETSNGAMAIDTLRTVKVDLILCEATMPDMTGMEVLRAVRDNDEFSDVPFLILTAERDQATVAEAGEIEVDAYILKPFTANLMQQKIEQVLEAREEPSPIKIHHDLGQVYLKSRQYDQAMAEFKKALKINPKSPRVLFAIGQIWEKQGDLAKAMGLYEQSITLSPMFLKGYEALANLCEAQGDLQTSAKHLKKVVSISPKNLNRQVKLGQILIATGQQQEAHEVFKLVMTVAKGSYSDVARQVGEVYLKADMLVEAQETLLQGLALNPNDIHLYNRLGIAYRKQKKFKEAVENYEQALKVSPEDENIYYNLGRAYYEAGDRNKSAAAMHKALQLLPDFEEAKTFLSNVLKI